MAKPEVTALLDKDRALGEKLGVRGTPALVIKDTLLPGVEIETYHDHRFAMSFGILGCHNLLGDGRPWLTIKDPACCAKTFPAFFDVLEKLRIESTAQKQSHVHNPSF